MDNCRGDLADILGASSGDGNTSGEAWQFQTVSDGNYKKHNYDYFGDPFSCVKDPLLDELDVPKSTFFDNLTDNNMRPSVVSSPKVRPSNIYSRIHQISPNTKLPISNDMIESSHSDMISSPNSSKTCLVGNSLRLHMSSSRMSCPGYKRRKSQAKKVVCIPATTPVNNRPAGGEVVPSDQWAWRKYGQKPIKGSPYPRGYYRCSSSKGCSARKQVERSRNDPKMLLITYSSDHNHPLPTQRNALAGSTRSQPLKGTISSSKVTTQAQKEHSPLANIKEESKTNDTKVFVSSPTVVLNAPTMKEERKDFDNASTTMDFSDDNSSYRPLLPPDMMGNGFHSEDFFAELGEIGDDDQSKMFFSTTPGFPSDHDGRESDKALDSFPSFFEWIGIGNTDNDPSIGDTNSGL